MARLERHVILQWSDNGSFGQCHLIDRHQIRHEVAHLLIGKILQHAVGHQRVGGVLHLVDRLAVERDRFLRGLQREGAFGLVGDDAIEHAAIVEHHDPGPEIRADAGTGIDDVFEQIIQVLAVRSGQVGPHVPAHSVQHVAVGAVLLEQRPALRWSRLQPERRA